MRLSYALLALVLLPATPAAAQDLVGETEEGTRKTCHYQLSDGSRRAYTVGLYQPCPATRPVADPRAPVPPYASLRDSWVSGDRRVCEFEDGPGRWTFSIPIDTRCPLSAGMLPASRRQQIFNP